MVSDQCSGTDRGLFLDSRWSMKIGYPSDDPTTTSDCLELAL